MHRLEPVAGVRQRAMHNGRQRIGEVTLLERLPQRDFLHPFRTWGNHFLVHIRLALARLRRPNKTPMDPLEPELFIFPGSSFCD